MSASRCWSDYGLTSPTLIPPHVWMSLRLLCALLCSQLQNVPAILTVAVALQQLGGQVSMRDMQIVVMSFDLPMHDLSRVRQPPAALTTVMRILQFKAEGKALDTLCNILLDHAKMERLALVTVRPAAPDRSSAPLQPCLRFASAASKGVIARLVSASIQASMPQLRLLLFCACDGADLEHILTCVFRGSARACLWWGQSPQSTRLGALMAGWATVVAAPAPVSPPHETPEMPACRSEQ